MDNLLTLALIRKLGPVKTSMIKRGMIKQVILMSPELTPQEKVILIKLKG